ncbi:MAG: PRC-barrel domain-containing protein [Bacteroidales bacterium]
MLRNVTDLRGYAIHATDGVIGKVSDLYFDDEGWAIRYLIVDTSDWLSGRTVLISPVALGLPDWMCQSLPVSLTRAQVAGSPDVDTRKPVSRQHEAAHFEYYRYPYYWGGAGLWGMGAYPGGLTTADRIEADMQATRALETEWPEDCHLRSCLSVVGHHIHATDGDIGHVNDMLVDDHTWAIRYLVVDTSNWWGGHDVLISPPWIEAVSWPEEKVFVALTRQSIKEAPDYDSAAQFHLQQEQATFEHYGRRDYWTTKTLRELAAPAAK